MNFLDRLAAAITPEASDEDRARARDQAMALAQEGDWLDRVLDQHQQIETLFAEALMAAPAEREMARRELASLLGAHSMAEEVVLYPAMARNGEKGHATMAYEEQAMTKIEMAALEQLDPDSDDWTEKLEKIRAAVAHHVYEEESDWFPELHRRTSEDESEMLSMRFDEEFDRHGDLDGMDYDDDDGTTPGYAAGTGGSTGMDTGMDDDSGMRTGFDTSPGTAMDPDQSGMPRNPGGFTPQ